MCNHEHIVRNKNQGLALGDIKIEFEIGNCDKDPQVLRLVSPCVSPELFSFFLFLCFHSKLYLFLICIPFFSHIFALMLTVQIQIAGKHDERNRVGIIDVAEFDMVMQVCCVKSILIYFKVK